MAHSGIDALNTMFAQADGEGRSAFLPYFPIGFPSYDDSLEAIEAMANVGVDGFEIGIPFSDPLADGPVVQAATQKALENGITPKKCIDAVAELRARGVTQPMLLMGYVNPILAYGAEQFVIDSKAAGVDGLIVPDLPPDEAQFLIDICDREKLALVFFLAPTSNNERIQYVVEKTTGFIYVVTLTGVTGERTTLPEDLSAFIQRIRTYSKDTRLVTGFGISQPHHAQMMNGLVDGFIVGSALVRAGSQGVDAVRELTTSIRRAIDTKSTV